MPCGLAGLLFGWWCRRWNRLALLVGLRLRDGGWFGWGAECAQDEIAEHQDQNNQGAENDVERGVWSKGLGVRRAGVVIMGHVDRFPC